MYVTSGEGARDEARSRGLLERRLRVTQNLRSEWTAGADFPLLH